MKTSGRVYPLVALATVAVGTVLALALPGGAQAVQVKSPPNGVVLFEAEAVLEANGAAVTAVVDYFCPTGTSISVEITVTQAVGDTIASGRSTRYFNSVCNGKPQVLRVAVAATQRPFVKGAAFGQVEGSFYGDQMLKTGWDDRTIRIG